MRICSEFYDSLILNCAYYLNVRSHLDYGSCSSYKNTAIRIGTNNICDNLSTVISLGLLLTLSKRKHIGKSPHFCMWLFHFDLLSRRIDDSYISAKMIITVPPFSFPNYKFFLPTFHRTVIWDILEPIKNIIQLSMTLPLLRI